MSWIAPEWVEHQRKRFMRPDAQRYMRPDAERWLRPGQAKETAPRYFQTKQSERPCETEQQGDAAAVRAEAEWLEHQREIASLRFEWEMLKLSIKAQKAGFNPEQPRDDRGRWTDSGASDVQDILSRARRVTAAGGKLSYQRCLDLCYPLLERFKPPGSDRNKWDFHKCMDACLRRK
jgi:hypothetical protein